VRASNALGTGWEDMIQFSHWRHSVQGARHKSWIAGAMYYTCSDSFPGANESLWSGLSVCHAGTRPGACLASPEMLTANAQTALVGCGYAALRGRMASCAAAVYRRLRSHKLQWAD
jgi:hypothetical protein